MTERTLILTLLLAFGSCFADTAPQQPQAGAPAAEGAPLRVGRVVETDVFLGIEGRPVTDEEAEACEGTLHGNRGLMVTRVIPGSPAEKADMRAGDIVTEMADMGALLRSMRHMRPGIPMHLTLLRVRENRREGQPRMQRLHVSPRLESRGEPVHVGRMEAKDIRPSAEAMAKIEQHQSKVIRILGEGRPDLAALNMEFDAICALLPPNPQPGHLRLFFKSRGETLSVTRRPGDSMPFTVSLHYPDGQSRLVCQLGTVLNEEFRSRFDELARLQGIPVEEKREKSDIEKAAEMEIDDMLKRYMEKKKEK